MAEGPALAVRQNTAACIKELKQAGESGNWQQFKNLWDEVRSRSKSKSKGIEAGIETEIEDTLLGAIFAAINNKNIDALRNFIRCKSTVLQKKDRISGGTALHEAVKTGDRELVLIMLSHSRIIKGIDTPDREGRTALHEVAQKDQKLVILRDLLGAGADIDARDGKHITPLHAAVLAHQPHEEQVVELMIVSGAEVNTRDRNGEFLLLA